MKPDEERFFQETWIPVLKIEGKCSRLRAKPAHFVSHLPRTPTVEDFSSIARLGARVSLRSMVSARHAQARGLFEREGYLSIREVWRVTLDLVESSSNGISHPGRCAIDLDGASDQLVGTTSLYDREGVYSVRQFVTYEKELCLAGEACDCPGESAETLIGV